jgi:hypothetical protein
MTEARILDIAEAQAFSVLGMLPREKLPAIAQRALEQGLDDPSLRILAGLTNGELDEAVVRFAKTLTGLGYGAMEKADALRICINVISLQIIKSEIAPYEGARLIWRAAREVDGSHEADPFIYAASEYEDRPNDRQFFAREILKEAKRRLIAK